MNVQHSYYKIFFIYNFSLTNPNWAKAGQDLRQLADAFSRSPEREILRSKAYSVNMSNITMDNFFLLCSELFHVNYCQKFRFYV